MQFPVKRHINPTVVSYVKLIKVIPSIMIDLVPQKNRTINKIICLKDISRCVVLKEYILLYLSVPYSANYISTELFILFV